MKFRHLYAAILVSTLSGSLVGQDTTQIQGWLKHKGIEPARDKHGIAYQIQKRGTGALPKEGDYVMVQFTGRLLNGKVFDASTPEEPFVFQLGYRQVIKGWDLGLLNFPVGSKGYLYLGPEHGYGKVGAGKQVPPNASLVYELEVQKILSRAEYDAYMDDLDQKQQAAFQAKQEEIFQNDKRSIQQYLNKKGWTAKRTASGVSVYVEKVGKTPLARPGDQLRVRFTGYRLDDKVFDSNVKKDPFTFTLGQGEVIAGWEEGLQYFGKKGKGWLLIPSKLGYGAMPIEEGETYLPANSVLIFYIEVEAVIPAPRKKG